MKDMTKFLVVTPPYLMDAGPYEPGYEGSDVVEVVAANVRQAKVLGLKELRRTRSQWVVDAARENPFKGLRAERMEN